eukprot:348285-Hanusia_phi.AAC.4
MVEPAAATAAAAAAAARTHVAAAAATATATATATTERRQAAACSCRGVWSRGDDGRDPVWHRARSRKRTRSSCHLRHAAWRTHGTTRLHPCSVCLEGPPGPPPPLSPPLLLLLLSPAAAPRRFSCLSSSLTLQRRSQCPAVRSEESRSAAGEATRAFVCFVTAPNEEVAATLAHELVASGCAACVNQVGGVKSTYVSLGGGESCGGRGGGATRAGGW